MNIYEETMKHFSCDDQDKWAGFKKNNVGGMQVIDLTSVDVDWSSHESVNRSMDIERQQIYGSESGNPNKM